MKKKLHIFVSGRVQGVFFRRFTEETAKKLGITGWVRNLSDGRVEIWAEGTDSVLKEFIDCIHRGPPSARVEDIEITEIHDTLPEYVGFKILW